MMDDRPDQARTVESAAVETAASAMSQAGWTVTDRGLTAPDSSVTVVVRCGLDGIDIQAFERYDLWPAEDDDPATWRITGPAMPAELIVSIVTAAAIPHPYGDRWRAVERAMERAGWLMDTESSHDVLMSACWTSPDGLRELVSPDSDSFDGWFVSHAPGAEAWHVTEAPEAVLLALAGVPAVR